MPLQRIFARVILKFDCRVLCGKRGKKEQDEAYDNGCSQLKYPDSKHNTEPLSSAADVVPYPYDEKDIERYKRFGYYVLGVAWGMDIPLRWGADWNMNINVADERWRDYAHFELIEGGTT
jgi:peptidoglycan L-alanyl-D-glutamate endopeptidase CwlK